MAIDGIKIGMDGGNMVGDAAGARAKAVDQGNHPADNQRTRATPAESDRLSLTHEAALLKDVEKRLASVPVVDAQKVERIRAEINQGTYSVDPAKVAEKLLNFEKLFNK